MALSSYRMNFNQECTAILLGAGSRLSVQDEGGSSVLVIVDGEPLLFDIGPMSVQRLAKSGVNPSLIEHVFITHLHMDHISEFPEFLSLNHTFGGKISVYGPPAARSMVEGAKTFLEFDLAAIERGFGKKTEVLVKQVVGGQIALKTEKYSVSAVQTPHLDFEGPHSFAYRVQSKYGSVVISGDTAPSLNVVELANDADLLFHEVFIDPTNVIDDEILETLDAKTKAAFVEGPDRLEEGLREGPPRFGHSVASEVGKVASAAEVKKLVLYHRPVVAATQNDFEIATRVWGLPADAVSYDSLATIVAQTKQHFDGPVIMGEPLMVFRVGASDE